MTGAAGTRRLRCMTLDIVSLRSLLLAAFLLFGIFLGYAAADRETAVGAAELRRYLDGYLAQFSADSLTAGTALRTAFCFFRAPVLAFLGYTAYQCAAGNPSYILAAVFCALQIIVYVLAFFPSILQKVVGLAIPVIVVLVLSFTMPKVDLTSEETLPDNPSFSEEATLLYDWNETFNVQLVDPAEGLIYIHASDYGTTTFDIQDGDTVYHYTLEIYNDNGTDRTRVTPAGTDSAE